MISDRDWQRAAKAMIAAAEAGRSVGPVLQKSCLGICRQLLQDRKHPALLALWGRCVNVDENVGQVIVHPAILRALGAIAGVPMRGRIVHAGLQHTYGYLFSVIDTPFGRKRARWITTDLERGLGIEASLLGPTPKQGTLLANLTWLLGHIVFREEPRVLRRLQQHAQTVSKELVRYDYRRLDVVRVVEEAPLTPREAKLRIITDLVHLPHAPSKRDSESHLLIYALQSGERTAPRLITAFGVSQAFVESLTASVPSHGEVEIRLRFNAYHPALYGRTVMGRRFIAEPNQN